MTAAPGSARRQGPRRVLIAGGTGLIGRHLGTHLLSRGDEVIVLSRDPRRAAAPLGGAAVLGWEPGKPGRWAEELAGVDAVVDMAGAPFFVRSKDDYHKREVIGSRATVLDTLLDAIQRSAARPATLINGSSVGAYGYQRSDQELTESSPCGKDRWGRDTCELEQQAARAEELGVRVVSVRTGVVLAWEAGALAGQLERFRRGFGGTVRPGTQWFPWIHIDDVVGLITQAIDDPSLTGPLNATAPEPVRYRDYARTRGRCVGRPARLPIPGWVLRHALGPAATTVTHGRRVIPARALQAGYRFKHPTLEPALTQLINPPATPPANA